MTDIKKLRKEWYKRLECDGFKDIERLGPDGEVDNRYLGKAPRTVSIYNYLPHDDGTLPADHTLFQYQEGPKARRFRDATEYALKLVLERSPWEECVAVAMYADGYSEREIADSLERSRVRVRNLLRDLKIVVD
jgi:hypothetical protein